VLYGGDRVIVIYPTNTIVHYDCESLEVIHVVQAAFNIVMPLILHDGDKNNETMLAFID
jgi:hypothetical protein